LRSKKSQDITLQAQAKATDSPFWKAICKVWPQVIAGTTWLIANGQNVRFWKDKWLDNVGVLIEQTQQELTEEESNVTVADMVDSNMHWK
jgi:hypothetical protein